MNEASQSALGALPLRTLLYRIIVSHCLSKFNTNVFYMTLKSCKQVNSQFLQKAFKLISYVPAMTLGSRCEPRTKVFKMFWQLSKLWGKTTNWEKASTNGFTKSRCCHPFTNKKQFNKNRIHGSYQCLTVDLLFLL